MSAKPTTTMISLLLDWKAGATTLLAATLIYVSSPSSITGYYFTENDATVDFTMDEQIYNLALEEVLQKTNEYEKLSEKFDSSSVLRFKLDSLNKQQSRITRTKTR